MILQRAGHDLSRRSGGAVDDHNHRVALASVIGARVIILVWLGTAAVGLMTFQPTGECVIEDTINIGGTMLSRTSDWCFYEQVGGRGTLIGPMVGAILVKGAQSLLSEQFAWIWDLLVGFMFILIIVLMPDGIMGALLRRARRRRAIAAGRMPAYEAARIEETPTT